MNVRKIDSPLNGIRQLTESVTRCFPFSGRSKGSDRFPKWTPVIEEPKDMATKKAAKKAVKKAAKKVAKKK